MPPSRRPLLLAALTPWYAARVDAREIMRGFGSTVMQDSDAAILNSLRELYSEKLRPLEEKGRYNQMREPALGDAWFDSKPMVLLIGQYSVGKTSFIRYLLGRDFPGAAFRIGPEPTTERFVAVMYGDQDKTTPGNALASQPDTPFHSLKKFGTNFLDRLESTQLPSPILKRVTLIDTPGVLNGEKQRSRGYDYEAVIRWFAQHSDRVLLLFDAHKTDIGDEFRQVVQLLREHAGKVRVVLNKADSVPPKGLLHVYGAMMWSLGGVVNSPEAARVYIGSFWDAPWQHTGMQELMESDEVDLIEDLASLPENNAISKINEIARRCRLVQAHVHLLCELRAIVKAEWFSRKSRQEAILSSEQSFTECMRTVQRKFDLSPGDFPAGADLHEFVTRLRAYDFADFYKPSADRSTKLKLLRELMEEDVPRLISRMHAVEQRNKRSKQQFSKFRPPRHVRPRYNPAPGASWSETTEVAAAAGGGFTAAAATSAPSTAGPSAGSPPSAPAAVGEGSAMAPAMAPPMEPYAATGSVLEAFKQRAAEALGRAAPGGGAPLAAGAPPGTHLGAAAGLPSHAAPEGAGVDAPGVEVASPEASPEAAADAGADAGAARVAPAWPAPTAADWPAQGRAPPTEPAPTGFGADGLDGPLPDANPNPYPSAGPSAAPYTTSGTAAADDGRADESGAAPGWQ